MAANAHRHVQTDSVHSHRPLLHRFSVVVRNAHGHVHTGSTTPTPPIICFPLLTASPPARSINARCAND